MEAKRERRKIIQLFKVKGVLNYLKMEQNTSLYTCSDYKLIVRKCLDLINKPNNYITSNQTFSIVLFKYALSNKM